VLGHKIASRIAYIGESLATAIDGVLADLSPYKIGAGLVSVDAKSEVNAPLQ
jgi:beta-aspartyl-peptidase (threonine type)